MRLGLVALACLLLAPHAVASAPAPLAIVYDLATGAVHAGPLATAAPVLEADGCATAWPAKLTCRGVLGTHEAIDALSGSCRRRRTSCCPRASRPARPRAATPRRVPEPSSSRMRAAPGMGRPERTRKEVVADVELPTDL
ncbi:MAG TPA: hypothetical protein VFH78_08210, partial [Candidatus Thermoplasmatota archaeon]|nr:hypothetical protein [Candidatus Thermoplasmatota archaeon]